MHPIYHFSALRTTTNLTDDSGNVKVSYRTDAFGNITKQEGSSTNRQVFTSQEHDEQTGLIYFGARFYDPDTARFTTQDSYLGEPGTPPSLHRYLYAYSNPTVYVDLYGFSSEESWFDAAANAVTDVASTVVDAASAAASAYDRRRTLVDIVKGNISKVSSTRK